MAPNPRRLDQRLQELYDRLPKLECRGLCHDSCGPIEMSVREQNRIEQAAGRPVNCGVGPSCCGIYEIRPMICRLWGNTPRLACPYGCVPEGGHIPDSEGMLMLLEADDIGGAPSNREQMITDSLLAALDRETLDHLARSFIQRPTVGGRNLPKTVIER